MENPEEIRTEEFGVKRNKLRKREEVESVLRQVCTAFKKQLQKKEVRKVGWDHRGFDCPADEHGLLKSFSVEV